jgi:hypothetical protein
MQCGLRKSGGRLEWDLENHDSHTPIPDGFHKESRSYNEVETEHQGKKHLYELSRQPRAPDCYVLGMLLFLHLHHLQATE